jgi:NAD(P)-dependent dehydrogenase (short-subunit alcohol dehydrogenase family)
MAAKFAEAGANVALVARRPEVLEQTRAEIAAGAAGKIGAYSCDVTDAAQIEATFAAASTELGPIDILVNNAGTSQRAPFLEISDEVWQADFDLKLFAAIRFCRLAMPGMIERRWGRIINTLNTGAKAPQGGGAPTAVSRAAGMALTKVLAGEGAPHNVLVNAMLVGRIDSDQWVRRHAAEASDVSYEDYLAKLGKPLPMGRFGRAEEFANLACFLASDAGSYITGTAINVDGGLCPVV